jgi:hypothetical protein
LHQSHVARSKDRNFHVASLKEGHAMNSLFHRHVNFMNVP